MVRWTGAQTADGRLDRMRSLRSAWATAATFADAAGPDPGCRQSPRSANPAGAGKLAAGQGTTWHDWHRQLAGHKRKSRRSPKWPRFAERARVLAAGHGRPVRRGAEVRQVRERESERPAGERQVGRRSGKRMRSAEQIASAAGADKCGASAETAEVAEQKIQEDAGDGGEAARRCGRLREAQVGAGRESGFRSLSCFVYLADLVSILRLLAHPPGGLPRTVGQVATCLLPSLVKAKLAKVCSVCFPSAACAG